MSSQWRRDPATTNPTGFGWLLEKFRKIEQRLSSLEGRAAINNATLTGLLRIIGNVIISGVGRLTFTNGGSILMRDHQGRDYFYAGGFAGVGFGIAAYRLDGSVALILIDDDPESEQIQRLKILDRNGSSILTEDASGDGISWPQQPLSFVGQSWPTWDGNDSGSFVTVAKCVDFKRTPRLQLSVLHIADAGTSGEARLLVNGTQVGPTVPVAAVTLNSTTFGTPVNLPGATGGAMTLEIQTRRTAGTGLVRARVAWAFGFGTG